MGLNIYIAAALADAAAAEQLAGALETAGHVITLPWWTYPDLRTIFDDDPSQAPFLLAERANAEVAAIQCADLVIAVLPGGVGTHVEIGLALGMGKPVILLDALDLVGRFTDGGRPYPCAFHYAAGVTRVRCLRGASLIDPVAEARFCAARCLAQLPAKGELWTHPKRGTTYEILSVGRLQAHDAGTLRDGDAMVTYKATVAPTDGYSEVSSRVLGEFMARFKRVDG